MAAALASRSTRSFSGMPSWPGHQCIWMWWEGSAASHKRIFLHASMEIACIECGRVSKMDLMAGTQSEKMCRVGTLDWVMAPIAAVSAASSVSGDMTCPHGMLRVAISSLPRYARNAAADLVVFLVKTDPSVKAYTVSGLRLRDSMSLIRL